ncbi:MAG: phytanoyl-CoA dioxygenase family protein [Myxococcota bacterium]|nr:phytanoyl-CoA dioxygenase family protein [Myxococcota bacterium]
MPSALRRHSRDVDPASLAASLERDGGAIVQRFLEPEVVSALAEDYDRELAAVDWCNTKGGLTDTFFGARTKRLHGLLGKSPHFAEAVAHPLLAALCEHFLRPLAHDFRVSTGELMAIGPGESRQALHRDADSWFHYPPPRPEILVSANLALTDFRTENGATVLVPGSQAWEPGRKPTDDDALDHAEMERGDALVYTGNVFHGGGRNETEETRIGLYWGYIPSWLRPLENHVVTNGLPAIEKAPKRVQELLDYKPEGWDAFP